MAEPQVRLLRLTKVAGARGPGWLLLLLLQEGGEAAGRGTGWVVTGCELCRVLGRSRLRSRAERLVRGFLAVCLKAERRRQVCDFYLCLARLTRKNTPPDCQVVSVTAWTQASSGFVQGLCLIVGANCWYPESSRYWEAKLLYFVRKQDSYLAYKRLQLLQDISHWASQLCNAEP